MWIVDQQRDVFAGLLAGAFPGRADLRANFVAHTIEDGERDNLERSVSNLARTYR
ncbi:hypothetical protein ABID25_006016 [Mesorhizobium abyssinicae]